MSIREFTIQVTMSSNKEPSYDLLVWESLIEGDNPNIKASVYQMNKGELTALGYLINQVLS